MENIIKHGINCFVNRQLIYNFPEEIFADAGVMAAGLLAPILLCSLVEQAAEKDEVVLCCEGARG